MRSGFAVVSGLLAAWCALGVGLGSHASAQDAWTVTAGDFSVSRGAITAISKQQITIRNAAGETTERSWGDILEISRTPQPPGVPDGVWVALVRGGQRLIGLPQSLNGEMLRYTTALGEFDLPVSQILAISRGSAVEAALLDPPAQDTVYLVNGDQIAGVLESVSPEGVIIAGSPLVGWDAVLMLKLAQVEAPASSGGTPALLVRLLGGGVLAADRVEQDAQRLKLLTDSGPDRDVPLASVHSIEHRGGPVVWLTSLSPLRQTTRAYFSDIAPPVLFNNGPLRDVAAQADQTARTSIAAVSYTRLDYAVQPNWRGFRMQFSVDGALPYANSTVRILLDDRVAYEFADLSAATPVQTVALPLDGAKVLSIEIDYGKTYDVQDRVLFIEPAFLRAAPATQP